MGGACSGSASQPMAVPNIKILLLGGANVGKSTIFKQMRILYKEGFENKDREWARGCIIENILETLIDLDAATDKYGVEVLEVNEDLVDEIKPVLLNFKVRDPNKPVRNNIDIWDSIERLWSDPGIQAVYQEIHRPTRKAVGMQVVSPVLSGYFLQQLDRVKRDDYVPSDDDILHLRRSTSASDSIAFKMNVLSLIGKPTTLNIECIDVGGQAHERTEWSKHSENLNAILYVLSLSEYSNINQAGQNILQTQLDLLKMVRETECFQKATIIVLLNKVDLLQQKLQGLKVSEYFPEYTGTNELDDVVGFFQSKVLEALGTQQETNEEEGMADVITTCATDTGLMKTIIGRIGQSILQKTLSESKFFG